MRLEKTV